MSFSFNSNLTTDLDWLRADLGDTDEATAILSDEQIVAVLASELARADGSRQTAKFCLAAQAVAVLVREPVKLDAAGAVHDYSQRLHALMPLAEAWHSLEESRLSAAQRVAAQPTASVRAKAVW